MKNWTLIWILLCESQTSPTLACLHPYMCFINNVFKAHLICLQRRKYWGVFIKLKLVSLVLTFGWKRVNLLYHLCVNQPYSKTSVLLSFWTPNFNLYFKWPQNAAHIATCLKPIFCLCIWQVPLLCLHVILRFSTFTPTFEPTHSSFAVILAHQTRLKLAWPLRVAGLTPLALRREDYFSQLHMHTCKLAAPC